jgi:glutamate N-acetyltransferase / amino-acid N-acetyltransferase
MTDIQLIDNTAGITDVPGFMATGVGCDIKQNGKSRLDLAIIYSRKPCTAAGVFTLNDLKAAPVRICQQILAENKSFHGIIANSGNANACTGEQGILDASTMTSLAEQACNAPKNSIFVCSTGRIGRLLPMQVIKEGIAKAGTSLGNTSEHGTRAAEAILTSDSKIKTVTAKINHKGKTITLAGIAKGAGMIQPNMATMLAFIATDAAVETTLFQKLLSVANKKSFNAISVDGDMSTNDTVIALANGESGINISTEDNDLYAKFQEALFQVCSQLATKIVKDGERVTKCITLKIEGTRTDEDAEKVARAVANSLLVKTSWYGNDPNWGRLADAAGYARVGLEENKLDIKYNDCFALEKGKYLNENISKWKTIVSEPEFNININLNLGKGSFQMLTTDLTEGYVDFNKSE